MKFGILILVLVSFAHSEDRLPEVPMFSFEHKQEIVRDSSLVKDIPNLGIVVNSNSLEVPFEKVAWENSVLLNEEYTVVGIHY